MLTSWSRDLITPFGTLKAGSYWLRQGWWSEVTAAFIFHTGSMETTCSNIQSSLLIQVAWQFKNPVFILSVIYLSPDEAKRLSQPQPTAAQPRWMHSAVTADKAEHSFILCKWELPETHTSPTDGAMFPRHRLRPKTWWSENGVALEKDLPVGTAERRGTEARLREWFIFCAA